MIDGLIPITDEQAKLGQEILKTFRGLGSFLERALGSTPEDLVGYFGGDHLRVRRAENMARMMYEAQDRLAAWGVEETKPATLSIALPILQGAADEDREELVDLWARLLANAMDPNMNSVRHSFIDAVKKMDPVDAVILKFLAKQNLIFIRYRPGAQENNTTHIGAASDNLHCRIDEVHVSLEHLKGMGFFDGVPSSLGGGQDYSITVINREFMRACYPEISPK